MPPQTPLSPIPNENEDRLLPPARKSGAGAFVGIIIIIVLMAVGGLYFWGARLNQQQNPPPYIPTDSPTGESTTSVQ